MKPARPKAAGLAVFAVLLAGTLIYTRCGRRTVPGGMDFSRSNRVSVVLGETDKEHGNGIEHIYWEKDGLTTIAIQDGVPCRHLKLGEERLGYLYFMIDPSFKKRSVKNVTIEVEYCDPVAGWLGLQYDATGRQRSREPAYTQLREAVPLLGSKIWQTATFRVQNAAFKNSQNSRADFRLWVSPPELYVRRATVTRARK
jgi:hypothetical protein